MTLQDRLQELVADHDRDAAVTLAKAAMKNEEIADVTVDADSVTVETRRFRGVHRWWTDEEGHIVIGDQGRYTCTCEAVDLSFSSRRMIPTARERAIARLRERVPDPERGSDASSPGDRRPESGPTPAETPASGPDGARESARDTTPGDGAPSPVPGPAVADGGTPTVAGDSRTTWRSRIARWIAALFP